MAYQPSPPLGSATSANSLPVVIASDQAAVPISDNGASLTVDGSVTVSGTVTANAGTGTQNVSVQNASIPVTDNGGSLTVDGSVSVSNFPATQPVSGTVTVQDGGGSLTVDGSVSVSNFPATQPVSGTVEIGATSLAALETISVSNFPATQPVSGTVTIQDGGNTITVDGTVTANAGTGTFATSDANAVSQATATAAQKGYLSLAGATATLPTYTAGNTNAMTMTTSGLLRVDGSNVTQPVDTELPAAVSLGDSTANPTAPHVGSCVEGFNGTTWDRLRTDGALAGTGANNTVPGIFAAGIGPGFAIRLNPTNLGTAANSASTIDVDGATTISIGVGTTTTGTFIFEGTADATNWFSVEVFDASADMWVSGQNITPAVGKVYHLASGGLRQIRLRTVTTLGATVAHVVNLSLSQQLIAGIDTGAAPHNFGYMLIHRDGEYTTQQTGVAIWTPASGKKFAISSLTISTGGTTSGVVTVWQGASGDTTYSAGTDPAVFRGEFAPSANSKPGVVKNFTVPFVSTTADHVLRVTTSAAMTVYVQVDGYEI